MPEPTDNQNEHDEAALKQRLTRRLDILKRRIESGTLKIPDRETIDELKAIRVDADGAVIPETVGSRVRAIALAAGFMEQREEAKSVNLNYVQTEYFGMLDELFGDVSSYMAKHNLSPVQMALITERDPDLIAAFVKDVEPIRDTISSFWDQFDYVIQTHLTDYHGVKAVYGGDIFPGNDSTACQAALYSDVIVFPDPIHRIAATLSPILTEEQLAIRFIKHGLTAATYRPLVFSETEFPIAVFASGGHPDSEMAQSYLRHSAEADAILHLNTVFGREAESLEDMRSYLVDLRSTTAIEEKAVHPERILHGYTPTGSLAGRIEDCLAFRSRVYRVKMEARAADVVMEDVVGRMAQANLVLSRGSLYDGVPLIDAPNSWQYLLWKYECDAVRSAAPEAKAIDRAIVNALMRTEEVVGDFLGKVSPDAIVALREQGALENLRSVLREGLAEMFDKSDAGDPDVAARVLGNLRRALEEHSQQLTAHAKAGREFFGLRGIAGHVVTTTISVAAVMGGYYALSLLAALTGHIGLPSAMELWAQGSKLVNEGQRLRRTPPGILISATPGQRE